MQQTDDEKKCVERGQGWWVGCMVGMGQKQHEGMVGTSQEIDRSY